MEADLRKLFIEQLQDIYDAERPISEALPKKIQIVEQFKDTEAIDAAIICAAQKVEHLVGLCRRLDYPPLVYPREACSTHAATRE